MHHGSCLLVVGSVQYTTVWRRTLEFAIFRSMTNIGWAHDTTQRVASELKKLRAEHTVQWLSDRTAELGHRIGRSRISDLERGDRGGPLGVAELIVLAKALRVPPLLLLYPAMSAGEVEVLSGHRTTSRQAAQWFSGRAPYRATDDEGHALIDATGYEEGSWLLHLADEEEQLIKLLEEIRAVRMETYELTRSMHEREAAAARLRNIRRQIASLGGEPLPWPSGVVTNTMATEGNFPDKFGAYK